MLSAAYFAAVNSVEFPILFVVVVCYGTICYWMVRNSLAAFLATFDCSFFRVQ